ncbi:MAG TPA: hypothetical protein VFT96_02305 [Gemmatimonadaceae bacterium]|nr:hypothetical protein [Gemmatimonadaceae bacterium]
MSNLPDRPGLDRNAVERVLARAAQLQAADTGEIPAERMTESQLVELGREVGLSPEHLRQALAEERTRLPAAEAGVGGGALERLVGPAGVAASRTIRIAHGAALAQLDAWMQREECLNVMRRFEDRILWEPRRDFMTQVRRGLDLGGRGFLLSRALTVAATVIRVDDVRAMVRLDADFTSYRRQVAGAGGVMATLGAGASGTAAAIGVMLPVAIVPAIVLGAGAVYQARRRHRALVVRGHLVLEQILDRLERGELARPSLLTSLAQRL